MIRSLAATAALAFLAFAPASHAGEVPCTDVPIDVAGKIYVAVDEVAGPTYLVGVWVYLESNGQPGLQRSWECDDPCMENFRPPDTCLF